MTVAVLIRKAHDTPDEMTRDELLALSIWAIEHDQHFALPWRDDWPIPRIKASA